MLSCLATQSPSLASSPVLNLHRHPPPLAFHGDSAEEAVSSITHPSPAVDINKEYEIVIDSNPYGDRWSITRPLNLVPVHEPLPQPSPARLDDEAQYQKILADLVYPKREHVSNALLMAKDSTLTRLISNFFHQSEDTSRLCLDLKNSVNLALKLYRPIKALLLALPPDYSLTQSQTDHAFDEFDRFHGNQNPFPSPDTDNLSQMLQCFSQLKDYLDRRLRKSNSKIRLVCQATTSSALCTGRFCTAYIPPKAFKKDPQNTVARQMLVLKHELSSLDSLSKHLHTAVECDRDSISFGLDRKGDKYAIAEVLKQLRRNHESFLEQMVRLDKHVRHCHRVVTKARCLLLEEIS